MKNSWIIKNLLFMFAFLAILVGGVYVLTSFAPAYLEGFKLRTEVKTRHVAPDFVLSDIEGKQLKLSDFKGRKVILHFWAAWNDFSAGSMALLESHYNAVPGDQVVLLMINSSEDKETVNNFMTQRRISSRVALDTNGSVAELYGLGFLPLTVFIDQSGLESKRIVGPLTADEIEFE
jgi:peroxiredoxin